MYLCEVITDLILWTPTHGRASVSRPTRTYQHQLCTDTGCSLENQPGAMDDRTRRREKESGKSVLAGWLDDDDLCENYSF